MRGTPVVFNDFRGGLNTKDAPFLLEASQARDLLNVLSTVRGTIRKRDGLVTHATPAGILSSLFALEATAPKWLVGATGTTLVSISTGGAVAVIGTGFTGGTRWEFAQAPASGGEGPLYAVNGVDTPQQWDGVAAAAAPWVATTGTVPNGKFIKAKGNRVWIAAPPGDPSGVYFSEIGDPRNWPVANVVRFDPSDGEAISGLGSIGPYVLVFKPSKCWVITDLDTGANRSLADNTGCAAHRSIVETPAGTFFLTLDRGVFVTNGSTLTPVSELVAPTIDSIAPGQRVNAAAAYYRGHYLLSICTTGSQNNRTLDYDLQLQSWWLHDIASNQFAVLKTTSEPDLYSAKASAAVVDRCFAVGSTQDNGLDFTYFWKGPWHVFGQPNMRKRVRQIRLNGQGAVDVYIGKDFAGETLIYPNIFGQQSSTTFGGEGTFGGDGVFGDGGLLQEGKVLTPGVAEAWSLRFQGAALGPAEVDGYTIAFTPRSN